MAYSFGDGLDLYATPADAIAGYWDSGTSGFSLVAGRFAGSQALQNSATSAIYLTKSSAQNDAVHHIVVAFRQTAALSGTARGLAFNLIDGTTTQCSIVFLSSGTILLTSGGTTGTTLATYSSAVAAANTWYAFEFEVVINNSTGSFTVRRDGATSASFSAASLNTRLSANNYANKVQIGCSTGSIASQLFDDFFWRSDASSVAWLGDIRCYTRMPASDASVQFTRSSGATNASCVDEAQQDAPATYVYDSTVAHADLYGIATIAAPPVSVVAVTTRAYLLKSDTGTRTAAARLKSGATTVASSTLTLTGTGWQWAWRMDLTDPATGSAWTAAAVDAAQAGQTVIA